MSPVIIVENLQEFEEVIFKHQNLSLKSEKNIFNLLFEFKALLSENPNLNFSKIFCNLADLIYDFEEKCIKFDTCTNNIDELRIEMSYLKNKLKEEIDKRVSDRDESFKIQDFFDNEHNVLKCQLSEMTDKLLETQDVISKVKCEKDDLIRQLSEINIELEAVRDKNKKLSEYLSVLNTKHVCVAGNKLDSCSSQSNTLSKRLSSIQKELDTCKAENQELNNCKERLLNSIKTLKHKSNEWSKYRWLDDDIITCFVQALQHSVTGRDDVLMVDPSISHLIKLCDPSDLDMHLCSLSLDTKKYIFMCVSNSSEGFKDDSATRWSLLFIDTNNNKSFHFDSAIGTNSSHAVLLSSKLNINKTNVYDLPCSQQNNSFECGLNLILNMKIVLNCYVLRNLNVPFDDWYFDFFASRPNNTIINITEKQKSTIVVDKIDHLYHKSINENQWKVQGSKKGSRPRGDCAFTPDLTLGNSFALLDSCDLGTEISEVVASDQLLSKRPTNHVTGGKAINVTAVYSHLVLELKNHITSLA